MLTPIRADCFSLHCLPHFNNIRCADIGVDEKHINFRRRNIPQHILRQAPVPPDCRPPNERECRRVYMRRFVARESLMLTSEIWFQPFGLSLLGTATHAAVNRIFQLISQKCIAQLFTGDNGRLRVVDHRRLRDDQPVRSNTASPNSVSPTATALRSSI